MGYVKMNSEAEIQLSGIGTVWTGQNRTIWIVGKLPMPFRAPLRCESRVALRLSTVGPFVLIL